MKLPTLGKLLILVTLADSALLIMMESERNAMLNECFTYDAQVRANGHSAGGEALQRPGAAMTLYWKNGKVAVTDGPYAETKEPLGGILALETRDLNPLRSSHSIRGSHTDRGI